MSKDKNYRKIMNSKEWRTLRDRLKYLANYQCQKCGGLYNPIDKRTWLAVHHLREIETGRTYDEMCALALNPQNCVVLCTACHNALHNDARHNTKESHQEREQQRVDRFMNTDINEDLLITL